MTIKKQQQTYNQYMKRKVSILSLKKWNLFSWVSCCKITKPLTHLQCLCWPAPSTQLLYWKCDQAVFHYLFETLSFGWRQQVNETVIRPDMRRDVLYTRLIDQIPWICQCGPFALSLASVGHRSYSNDQMPWLCQYLSKCLFGQGFQLYAHRWMSIVRSKIGTAKRKGQPHESTAYIW